MSSLGPDGRRLAATLVDLNDVLINYGVDDWAARLRGDRSSFERGDPAALDRLTAILTGPDSLEGLTIDAAAGHDIKPADVDRINAKFRDLREQCVALVATVRSAPAPAGPKL